MAISFIAMLAGLVSVNSPPDRLIVATAEKPTDTLVRDLGAMSVANALKHLESGGFVQMVQDGRIYLVDPILMQAKLSKNLPRFYESISKLSQGPFRTEGNPHLMRFAEAAFGDRFDRLDSSSLALNGAATVELVGDGRSLTLRRESELSAVDREALERAPLLPRDQGKPRSDPAMLDEFSPRVCGSINVFVVGKPESRQLIWANDIEVVAEAINKRLQGFQGIALAAVHVLFSKLRPGDFASQAISLEKGQSFASAPSQLKTSLQAEVIGNYQRFGFADQSEAEAFLAKATIGDVTRGFKVTGAKKKSSFVSVILYP